MFNFWSTSTEVGTQAAIMSMSPAEALMNFIQGPDGLQWKESRFPGWQDPQDPDVCNWQGIKCTDAGEIYELNLSNSGLTATLPASLGRIMTLQSLYLSGNNLFGNVPDTWTTMLTNLKNVDLSHNDLRGNIPIFNASGDLENLNLSNNKFEGALPQDFGTRLGMSVNLQMLDLSHNYFNGELPSSIGELPYTLKELDLSENQFVGALPDSLKGLTELEGFNVADNYLSGPVPPSMGRMTALKQVFLQNNAFSGDLPTTLDDLPHLFNLFINGNKFEGTISSELCDKGLNDVLYYTGVAATAAGEVSGRGRRRLSSESVDGSCASIACPAGTASTEDNGVSPCEACPYGTTTLYLGSTSCLPLDQNIILKEFLLQALGDNSVEKDSFDACNYEGITCNNAGNVVNIVLSNKGLSGTISPSLGLLDHLEVLDLSDNTLSGYLPSELHFAPLETLDVSNNRLKGVVPPSLCQKQFLNGNGEGWFSSGMLGGEFSCDAVACPVGTFSKTGMDDQESCIPCPAGNADYLGMTTCTDGFKTAPALLSSDGLSGSGSSAQSFSLHYQAGAIFGVMMITFLTLTFLCVGCLMFQRRRKLIGDINDIPDETMKKAATDTEADDDEFVDPEDDVPTTYKQSPEGLAAAAATAAAAKSSASKAAKSEVDQIPTDVQIAKSKNAWSSGKEQQTEVWLDIPKIQ